jgi:hypothetical protein
MSDFDLASLQVAAATDPRPSASAPDEIPTGTSPADQAVAGYAMAVNLVTRAAELDCDADWCRRQRIYAAETARLQTEGGTADPAVIDQLKTERVRATLNARYCAELHTIAQAGYERIFELMDPLRADLTQLAERQRRCAEPALVEPRFSSGWLPQSTKSMRSLSASSTNTAQAIPSTSSYPPVHSTPPSRRIR